MQTAEQILFGHEDEARRPVLAILARRTGKSKSTLSRWAKDADSIPLKDLRVLVRSLDLSDRKIVELLRGR